MKIQNQSKRDSGRNANRTIISINKVIQTLTSSWSIGAIITAVSAWTAGILYV
ncbi:MAG: hypothetical protein I4O51_02610 [Flavobacterium micromati]|jgi:hypothetical protein|nr:hypothetical protein [Flavobacterium micromati]